MISATEIKEQLTTDDIIKLCCSLQGNDNIIFDNYGHPIFDSVLDHPDADSKKLYYYPESKMFHCFTGDGDSYDIFELVRRFKNFDDFIEAYKFVIDFFHLSGFKLLETKPQLTDDWDIFQQMDDYEEIGHIQSDFNVIPENLLEYFYPLAAPSEWIKDGISPEVMRFYGIRIDSALLKIIIPHRDMDGNLIGIRGRSYNPLEVAEGKKYMPVMIEGEFYRHPLGQNLYGLYENQKTIKKLRKVLIVEAEKSVMQCASFYGVDNCFVLATCGSNLSQSQIDIIMSLGVEEVMLGYDKEYQGDPNAEDAIDYEKKLLKIIQPLAKYFNTYIIMDRSGLLNYKDSPTDRGKEVLEKLMKTKIYIPPIDATAVKKR